MRVHVCVCVCTCVCVCACAMCVYMRLMYIAPMYGVYEMPMTPFIIRLPYICDRLHRRCP